MARRWLTAGLLIAAAMSQVPSAMAQTAVEPSAPVAEPAITTIPGTPPADRELRRAVPPPRPPWRSRHRIVYAFDRPAVDLVSWSAELSAACRRGEFIQRVDQLYRAFGPRERPLGVAYGRAAINLVDPGQRRRDDTVYFFKEQDTARCAVYTARLDDIRPYFIGP